MGLYVEPFCTTMGTNPIPSLAWDNLGIDCYRVKNEHLDKLAEEVLNIVKILTSMLTPWQKINAENMFALSKLSFKLTVASLNRSWASEFYCWLRKKMRSAFGLPKQTISSYFHLLAHIGGMDIHSMEDNLQSSLIIKFFKCLSSKDKWIVMSHGTSCGPL